MSSSSKLIKALGRFEYFEVIEYPHWKENAFGEIDDLAIWWIVSLKEEYQHLIDIEKEQSVALELSAKYKEYGIIVDYQNKRYSYTDSVYEYEAESENTTITFDLQSKMNYETNTIDFLRVFSSGVFETDKDGEMIEAIHRYYDVSVLRAEGKIYLIEQ